MTSTRPRESSSDQIFFIERESHMRSIDELHINTYTENTQLLLKMNRIFNSSVYEEFKNDFVLKKLLLTTPSENVISNFETTIKVYEVMRRF